MMIEAYLSVKIPEWKLIFTSKKAVQVSILITVTFALLDLNAIINEEFHANQNGTECVEINEKSYNSWFTVIIFK